MFGLLVHLSPRQPPVTDNILEEPALELEALQAPSPPPPRAPFPLTSALLRSTVCGTTCRFIPSLPNAIRPPRQEAFRLAAVAVSSRDLEGHSGILAPGDPSSGVGGQGKDSKMEMAGCDESQTCPPDRGRTDTATDRSAGNREASQDRKAQSKASS